MDQAGIENASLQAALVRSMAAPRPTVVEKYEPAFVYSRYPFNFQNELLVSAGADAGVEVGQAALITASDSSTPTSGPAVVIGQVVQVFPDTALVRTVFDPSFQLAVRLGDKGADALLKGGTNPKLTLIPKTTTVNDGTVVYTATPDMPYGLPVGTLSNERIAGDQLFQEADLRLGYDIPDIRIVWLTTGHQPVSPPPAP